MSRTDAIITDGLTKTFEAGDLSVTAVDEVSVLLKAGELTLLMGPSGSGKSTLAAMLGGLMKPTSGSIVALGAEISNLSRAELDRFRLAHVGFVFQKVHLFPSLRAVDQIIFALQFAGLKGRDAEIRAHSALDQVDMLDKAGLRPRQMSGGENQRVAIARTLAMRPTLIFADEPTSSLDSQNGQDVMALLHKAAKTYRAMVLCVTHDDRLKEHADRVLYIEDGRLHPETQ